MEAWLTPSLIVALLALILSAANSHYARKRDNKKEIEELEKQLADLEANVKVLKMQMELFWKTVEQQMAKKFRDE